MNAPWLNLDICIPLDRFDLRVEAGFSAHVTGIFGPSGSGKTTLLETIAGLRRQTGGLVRMDGMVWQSCRKKDFLRPERRGIGYVPQEHLLFPHYSVRQNLLAGAARAQAQGPDVGSTLKQVASMLELEPLLERPVNTLSGGERQRVSLGRALCSGPRLLLLDEPLSALDGKLRHRILPFLLRVREEFKAPILIVSHQPLELQTLCDEVIAMQEGRILTRGSPVEVFTNRDVYGHLASGGYENILSVEVTGIGKSLCRLRLVKAGQGAEVFALPGSSGVGKRVTIGIRACDILVSLSAVSGLSARNRLPARVRELESVAGRVILKADIEGASDCPPVAVEMTEDSVEELHLKKGMEIQLIFKSSAVTLYD